MVQVKKNKNEALLHIGMEGYIKLKAQLQNNIYSVLSFM